MDEIKLAYFAGIIDGEGHIGCQIYSGKRRPVLQLQMTCKKTVSMFADYFGMTMRELNSPSHQRGYARGYKQIYHTRCECHYAYAVVKKLRPYLVTKTDAADEVLAYYENRTCEICSNPISVWATKQARYCSAACRQKAKRMGIAKPKKRKGEFSPPYPSVCTSG